MIKRLSFSASLLVVAFFLGAGATEPLHSASDLELQFASPPRAYAPSCFWWWFGCPYTTSDIHQALDGLKAAGLGGFRIFPVYSFPGVTFPAGVQNSSYLSTHFLEMENTAIEYGRTIGLIPEALLGTGWPFGGPEIPAEMGAGQLKFYSRELTGPSAYSGPIPGQAISPETLLAVQAIQVRYDGAVLLDTMQDLTGLVNNWELTGWAIPSGRWLLMTFVRGYTGMKVKRASPGGEGLVLDHFSRKAFETHLRKNAEVQLPYIQRAQGVTMDSWEVFGSNWTPELPVEFERRRGYSLLPFLPVLFLPAGEMGERIRYDFRRTLSELALDNCFGALKSWAQKHGLQTRVEAHGTPADILEAYGLNDIPEGESYGEQDQRRINLRDRKLASSAAHLFGRRQVSCESFTWLRYPLFLVTLENMKAAADAIYLDGINHINYHGVPFSPLWAEPPGWYYYAATQVSPGNTWWPYVKHLSNYLRRANFLLQQGEPVVDVAVYLPYEDVWSQAFGDWFDLAGALEDHFSQGGKSSTAEMLMALQNGGFNFDFINSRRLVDARCEDKNLLAGSMRYSVLILPGLKAIEPEALQKTRDFCRSGGTVIATDRLPERSPGKQQAETETLRVQALVREIFGDPKDQAQEQWRDEVRARGRTCGKGEGIFLPRDSYQTLVPGTHLLPRIVSKVLAQDLSFEPAGSVVGFVHRNLGSRQLYFIANLSGQEKRLHAIFRVAQSSPKCFDAESGTIEDLPIYRFLENRTEARLTLKPWGSTFIVFDHGATPEVEVTNIPGRLRVKEGGERVEAEVDANGHYYAQTRSGRLQATVSDLPAPLILSGPWQLVKEKGSPRELAELISWTSFPEFEGFSGTASYRCKFRLNADYLDGSTRIDLDLGEVCDIAEVRVNDAFAGVMWKHPYRMEIGTYLRRGENSLEVSVTNRLINRMRLKADLPSPYSMLADRVREPVPSGLLGPVLLRPSRRLMLNKVLP